MYCLADTSIRISKIFSRIKGNTYEIRMKKKTFRYRYSKKVIRSDMNILPRV